MFLDLPRLASLPTWHELLPNRPGGEEVRGALSCAIQFFRNMIFERNVNKNPDLVGQCFLFNKASQPSIPQFTMLGLLRLQSMAFFDKISKCGFVFLAYKIKLM